MMRFFSKMKLAALLTLSGLTLSLATPALASTTTPNQTTITTVTASPYTTYSGGISAPPPSMCRTQSVLDRSHHSRAQRRARYKRCIHGGRMTNTAYSCLVGAVGTAFGVGVGVLITGGGALAIAGAIIGGGAGGCATTVLESVRK